MSKEALKKYSHLPPDNGFGGAAEEITRLLNCRSHCALALFAAKNANKKAMNESKIFLILQGFND